LRNWWYHRPAAIRRTVRRLMQQATLHPADVNLYLACHLWQDQRDVDAPSVLPRRHRAMMDAAMAAEACRSWRAIPQREDRLKVLVSLATAAMGQDMDEDHMVCFVADAGDDGRPDPERLLLTMVVATGDAADDLLDAAQDRGFSVPGAD
jgi:hypothetical protein